MSVQNLAPFGAGPVTFGSTIALPNANPSGSGAAGWAPVRFDAAGDLRFYRAITSLTSVANINNQNPATTTSATIVMMGLGGVGLTLTPAVTGNAVVQVRGMVTNNTNGDISTVGLYFGTGTAPTNGAAVTGTRIAGLLNYTMPAANQASFFEFVIPVPGLTLSTAYWFDVGLSNQDGASVARVYNVYGTVSEV